MGSRYNKDDLERAAVVFSPHFDDETLGSGGLTSSDAGGGESLKCFFRDYEIFHTFSASG